MLICKENLHTWSASNIELNIFWTVYKQYRLFLTKVNSNHRISLQEELYNAWHFNFVIIRDDPAQDVFIFFGENLSYDENQTR